MKFGISEGMVLAAGVGGSDIFVLSPDAKPPKVIAWAMQVLLSLPVIVQLKPK